MEESNIMRLRVELDLRKRDYEGILNELFGLWEVEGPKDDWEKAKLQGLMLSVIASLSRSSKELIGGYDSYVEALESLIPEAKVQ